MFRDKEEIKKIVNIYKNSLFQKRKNCQNQLFRTLELPKGLQQCRQHLRNLVKRKPLTFPIPISHHYPQLQNSNVNQIVHSHCENKQLDCH